MFWFPLSPLIILFLFCAGLTSPHFLHQAGPSPAAGPSPTDLHALVLYCPPMANTHHAPSGARRLCLLARGTGWRSGDQTSWGGPNEKGLHTGETGPTDDAAQDGHVGWWLRTAVKKHVSRMDTKRLPSFLFDRHFGKTSTLSQLLLYYFQLNCTNKHVHEEPDIVYRDKCGQLSWGPDGSATMAAQGGLWWEWVIDFRLDWLW